MGYCLLLLFFLLQVAVHAGNFTLISPQVDLALARVPDGLWDAAAGVGIVIGTIFAFVGSRMLRTSAFFFGAFVGAVVGAAIVGLIDFHASSEAFISVSVILGLGLGLLVACFVRIAKFASVIAVGVICAGVFNQYVLSYFANQLEPWVIYVVLAVFVVLVAALAWRFIKFAMIFASAILGGFVVLLAVARLARGPISLVGIWADPEFLVACVEMTCWGPFIAGMGVCVLGLSYQLRKFMGCGKRKRPPPPPVPTKAQTKSQRRTEHEVLDAKLLEIETKLKQLDEKQSVLGKQELLAEKKQLAKELRRLPLVVAVAEEAPEPVLLTVTPVEANNPAFVPPVTTAPAVVAVAALPPNKPRLKQSSAGQEEEGASKFAGKWAAVENRFSVDTVVAPQQQRRNSSNATESDEVDGNALEQEIKPVRDLFVDVLEFANWALVKVLEGILFGLVLVGRCVRYTYDAYEDSRVERKRQKATSHFRSGEVRQGFST
ncbi:hypothetical protein BASA81_007983 [Batrachochytrium salamandrivorans]|nr:hypothetical protein BASA81_007983 [Batrachochytrium salamandrivorans]